MDALPSQTEPAIGGSGFAGPGGQPQDTQSKQSFQTDYHSCFNEDGGGGRKTLMERQPFSLLLKLCERAWVRDRDRDRERERERKRDRGKYRTRVEPFPQKVRGVNTGEAHK